MKKNFCPICGRSIRAPNCWVRFHVRYGRRPIVILACKYCNWLEMILRTKSYAGAAAFFLRSPYAPQRWSRAEMLLYYLKKFDIDLLPKSA